MPPLSGDNGMIIITETWGYGQSWYPDQDMSVHWVDAGQSGPLSFAMRLRSLHSHDLGAMWEALRVRMPMREKRVICFLNSGRWDVGLETVITPWIPLTSRCQF